MPEKSIKRPINFPAEVLKTLDRLAAKEHTTTSELVRRFVEKGLAVEGHKEEVEFIAGIIRQELLVVYHIEDIKAVVEQQANRIVKMHMKNCDRWRCLLRRWGGEESLLSVYQMLLQEQYLIITLIMSKISKSMDLHKLRAIIFKTNRQWKHQKRIFM